MRIPVLLASALLFPVEVGFAQAPPPLALEPVSASTGTGTTIHGERGLLAVPLVRSNPASPTIHVEVHRFRALREASGVPPIVLLHGGPGWPGLAGQLGNPSWVRDVLVPYLQVTDLVVVGQRGIGSSTPNTACPAVDEWPGEPARRMSAEAATRVIRDASRACRAHWEAQGYDLRGFNVLEAAADVDAVRRALGYDQITIWGVSFGSHWGMTVMRRYPETVARAVLSGMEGPDHTYDNPSGVLAALEGIAGAAERASGLSPLVPEGGIIPSLRRLLRQLDTAPVTVQVPRGGTPVDVSIHGDDLRDVILGYSGRTSSRNGMRTWPADLLRVLHGDWAGLAAAVARQRSRAPSLPPASFWMLDCGSGITRERHARYAADPAQEVVGDPGGFYDAGCPAWGSDLGDGFRQNFRTEIPTLIVHGNWDTSTPLSNATELAPFFAQRAFVVVEGGSHGALFEAIREVDGFWERIQRFLVTGDVGGFPERVSLPPIEWVVPEIR